MALRHMLGDEYPGTWHLAANRRPLDHSHQQQQDRRPQANLCIGRQQPHDQGRHGHHEDAQGEHLLAPQQIAEVRHDDAAQGPRQIARGKDAESLHQAQPFRHIDREEQLANYRGEEYEDDEIVEFQRPTQGRERQRLVVATGQRARRLRDT
ncbi:hypothetical protein D3C85_837450 [compost metagenome]